MGNSLNNAFVRAYAKDRQSHPPLEPSPATDVPAISKPVAIAAHPAPAAAATAPNPMASFPITPFTYVQAPTTAASQPAPLNFQAVGQPLASQPIAGQPIASQPTQISPVVRSPIAHSTIAHSTIAHSTFASPTPARAPVARVPVASPPTPRSQLPTSQLPTSPRPSSPLPSSHRPPASGTQHADIDAILRRIDQAAAAPFVAPHVSPRPGTVVAAGVGAQSNNVAKRLQAASPHPVQEQQASVRPILVESAQEPLPTRGAQTIQAPENSDFRRKSIMDYLYSAGQVSTKSLPVQSMEVQSSGAQSSGAQSIGASAPPAAASVPPPHTLSSIDFQRLVSSSIVDAWNGSANQVASSSSIAIADAGITQVEAPKPVAADFTRGAAKSTPSFVESNAQKPPSKMTAGHAPSMLPNYSITPQPAAHVVPVVTPSQIEIQQANISSRQGEILRVDVPRSSAQAAQSASTEKAAKKPESHPSPFNSKSNDSSERAATVERKLRLAKTRVFNPVWEVDELQWPHVCRQLLQQRAASLAEVVKNLKTACQEGLQVLGITSSNSGEGTTTVASCLALLCAQHGLKVVLIDGNIGQPSLCAQTNLEIESDWRTSIVEQLPLEEIAVHSITDQLTLIPLHAETTCQEILPSDQRIANMIRELSDAFDLVIVDVGAINSTSALITNLARESVFDAAMIVVDRRRAEPKSVDNCITRIQHTGISSIGIVENFAA